MKNKIEQLLRLVADYDSFCSDDYAKGKTGDDSDELSLEELDFVAAAVARPEYMEEWKKRFPDKE